MFKLAGMIGQKLIGRKGLTKAIGGWGKKAAKAVGAVAVAKKLKK